MGCCMPRMSDFRNTAWIMFPCIMAIICLGVNLIYGFNGQFSLGQWGFYGIGAYASAIITYRFAARVSLPVEGITVPLPGLVQKMIPMAEMQLFHFDAGKAGLLLIAIAVGGLLAALISLGFGYIVLLRLGSDYFGIATLGFTVIVQILLINSDRVIPETKGARGMVGIPQITSFFWAFLFLVLATRGDAQPALLQRRAGHCLGARRRGCRPGDGHRRAQVQGCLLRAGQPLCRSGWGPLRPSLRLPLTRLLQLRSVLRSDDHYRDGRTGQHDRHRSSPRFCGRSPWRACASGCPWALRPGAL